VVVEEFLEATLFQDNRKRALSDICHTPSPLIECHQKFKEYIPAQAAAKKQYDENLNTRNAVIFKLRDEVAFKGFRNTLMTEKDFQYFWNWAYLATLPEAARQEWVEIYQKSILSLQGNAIYHEGTEKIIQEMINYLDRKQETLPEPTEVFKDLFKLPTPIDVHKEDLSQLDQAWMDRARQLKVHLTEWDRYSYSQFLQSLNQQLNLNLKVMI
jgi:hypothetical protein